VAPYSVVYPVTTYAAGASVPPVYVPGVASATGYPYQTTAAGITYSSGAAKVSGAFGAVVAVVAAFATLL
jgi:hypothetical protein